MVPEKISRYFFYPLWEIFSSRKVFRFYHHLKILEKSQFFSKSKLKDLQLKKLKKLIEHAYKNVPFYRKLFKDIDIKPEDIKCLEDIQKIPILTKEIIRANLKDLLAENYGTKDFWIETTGGSTGTPLKFYRDNITHDFLLAVNRRFFRWAGYNIGTKFFSLWGSQYDISKTYKQRSKVHYFLINHVIINAFDMSDDNMKKYADKIITFEPTIIHGYANALYVFAKYIKDNRIRIPVPKAVISASEKLHTYQRELLKEVFQCEVFEEYGCREMSLIAHECEVHDGLHIASEKYILEIIKNGKPAGNNVLGSIVLTDLNNFAMPFIRYKNGDLSRLDDNTCRCGRGLEKIRYLEGRTTDYLINSKGKRVSGVAIITYFAKISGIKEFQILQMKKNMLEVRIVKSQDADNSLEKNILDFIRKYIGPSTKVKIKYVKKISSTNSGKRKAIILNPSLAK